MYARVITLWVFPDKFDELTHIINGQVAPLLKQQEGFHGVQLLTSARDGKCMISTRYESEADVMAAEAQLPTWLDIVRAANIVSGSQEVDTYEVRKTG